MTFEPSKLLFEKKTLQSFQKNQTEKILIFPNLPVMSTTNWQNLCKKFFKQIMIHPNSKRKILSAEKTI